MGEAEVQRLIDKLDDVRDRLARIEENQDTTKAAIAVERESRIACFSDCNRRIASLEISRARLTGWIIGAAAGGGAGGGLLASLIRSAAS